MRPPLAPPPPPKTATMGATLGCRLKVKQLLATVALGLAATASANDPAGSWLSYAAYTDPGHGIITALNTTWKVPSNPASNWGSNAPG